MRGGAPLLAALVGAIACAGPGIAPAREYLEPPFLERAVAAGEIPPVSRRLPATPALSRLEGDGRAPGRYGGTLRILGGKANETRLLVVYGYARLVCYAPDLRIAPDILESVEVEGGRVFTLRLRKGHRWSDGHPFTAEDFRYFWDDVANDKDISPMGVPAPLLVDGEPPVFTVIDERTVRYAWSKPNPDFLPALAGATPLYVYRPAHYLKRFHAKYEDMERLDALAKEAGARNWAALHHRMDNMYRNDNPALPTLDPWVLKTTPPSERFIFERNPYYHRVDESGRQLPYIDRVVMSVADGSLIPAKAAAGESDLQARYIQFDNFTFLKQGEKTGGYSVRLWRTGAGSHLALFPNLNAKDPVWRALLRDVRFRRALSLAINRREINQVVYFGLAREGADTMLPDSPLYRPEYERAWADFDLALSNQLLDELGLVGRDGRGVRLLPNGRPLEIIVETAGESTEQTDVLELIADSWLEAGVKLYTRPSQREVFRNRIFAGDAIMSVWSGLENGLATADESPAELAPTSQVQYQWPKWGQHAETDGKAGEPISLPEAARLLELSAAWRRAHDSSEREAIWHEMLGIFAEQAFTIGIVRGTLQPIVVSNRLKNVPEDAVFSWIPGAHFGIFKPDSFWLEDPSGASTP